MSRSDERPYMIRTYDRWFILLIVLVAGWYLFRPIFAYTAYYRGVSFERMIQTKTAEHYYRKAIAIYPAGPDGWIALGELYYMWAPAQPAYYERGVDLLRRGLAFNPENAKLAFDLGRMYFRAHDYGHAIPVLLQSARNDPRGMFAWDYAAWASLHLGRRVDAGLFWRRALRITPSNPAVLAALKHYGV
ncbi:MAG: tetratricopeptide repeat protein [Candidatus Eremiobacteraeota bacterium]|nr:tetratricopeptide repeat protein [Candidatus Eremiobacteraeota bacterium]MBC5828007.1 tetratricopeptide repeat protein [Candidatus Eremiobacteraeota bacterium]